MPTRKTNRAKVIYSQKEFQEEKEESEQRVRERARERR
jgi:hypothetical protein